MQGAIMAMTDFPPISEETKIEVVKDVISSKDGWVALALSVQGKPDAKEQCIKILQKIAGDKEVDVHLESLEEDDVLKKTSLSENVKIKLINLYLQQLEDNLNKLERK